MPVKFRKYFLYRWRHRARYLAALKITSRKYYQSTGYARRKKEMFGEKRCRMCDILLANPTFGAEGTRIHCGSCKTFYKKKIWAQYMKKYRRVQKKKLARSLQKKEKMVQYIP